MKYMISMTIDEAKDLARNHYGAMSNTPVEITDLPKYPVDLCMATNKAVAANNKIALIKLVRQVIFDSKNGNQNVDGSLAGAKTYVEKYFQI